MGVRGIVSNTAHPDTLLECLRSVARGQTWIEGTLAAEIVKMRQVLLSPRQKDVLQLLVRGFKNKEIAWELGLSVGTVKAYLTTLFEKVGARDRFELALFGLKYLERVDPQPKVADTAERGAA
jgi:DNA-binding NarL/FixJ family response regulator